MENSKQKRNSHCRTDSLIQFNKASCSQISFGNLTLYLTLTPIPPLLRSTIISQHLLTFRWAFSCIWTSAASQATDCCFNCLVQLCPCAIMWLLIHTAGHISSQTLYTELWARREVAWLGWITSKSHFPWSHTALDRQSWYRQKNKFRSFVSLKTEILL